MPNPIPSPSGDVYPQKDADLALWADYFSNAWDPANFGSTLPTAVALGAASANFTTALANASNVTARTPQTVATKDQARAALVLLIRQAARIAINFYRTAYAAGNGPAVGLLVTELGLRLPDMVRTNVQAPAYAPLLVMVGSKNATFELRATQVDGNGNPVPGRGFPKDVAGFEIGSKVGDGEWGIYGVRRRVKLIIPTAGILPGTLVMFRIRYITRKGEVGPWSEPVGGYPLD